MPQTSDIEGKYRGMVDRIIRTCRDLLANDAHFYVFGSIARGEMTTSSDIDVAIDTGTPVSLARLSEIREHLEASRIPYRVDVLDLHRVPATRRSRILEEAILWETD